MFKVDAKDFNQAIKETIVVVGNIELIYISHVDKKIIISAQKDKKAASFILEAIEGEGKDRFAISPAVLTGTLGSRKTITITFEKKTSTIVLKDGNYNGKLIAASYSKIDVVPEDLKGKEVDAEFRRIMMNVIEKVTLSPLVSTDNISVSIRSNKEEFNIVCGDGYHTAAFKGKKLSATKMDISLPVDIAPLILEFLTREEGAKIGWSKDLIAVWGPSFSITLPLVTSNQFTIEDIFDLQKTKDEGQSEINTKDILSAMDTFGALKEKGTVITMAIEGKDMLISSKSTFGEGSVRLKLKDDIKKTKLRLPPDSLLDTLYKLPEQAIMYFGEENKRVGFSFKTKYGRFTYYNQLVN